MVILDHNLDALPAFQKNEYSPKIKDECMHDKVGSTVVLDIVQILSASPTCKAEKFGVLISVLIKVSKNRQKENYATLVSSKPHSIQMIAMNY